MAPRQILVTGATGFIGAAVIRRLASITEYQIAALTRRLPALAAESVHWVASSLDRLEPSHWASFDRFDVVLHLGAFTPKTGADRDRADEIIAANIVGTQRLLNSLPQPPRRLVFCSTLDVYGRSAFQHPVNEQSPVGPVGLYGLSKLFGEGLAEAYGRASGCEHVVLRIGHVYGPGEERYAKLVPETIRRVLAGQPPRMSGDGSERRDLLYVGDAVEALVRACEVPLQGVGTINVAGGQSYAVAEVVETIARLAGYEGPIERLPPVADAYSTVFNTSRMTQVLGAWDHVRLADGLAREIAYVRQTT